MRGAVWEDVGGRWEECGEWEGLETCKYEDRTSLVVSCVPLKTPMTSTTDSSRDMV